MSALVPSTWRSPARGARRLAAAAAALAATLALGAGFAGTAAGAWSSPVDLSPASRDAESPDVAVDALGNATVVWRSHVGTDFIIQARRVPAVGAPGPILDLSAAGANASHPHVAVAPLGDATVIWELDDGSSRVVQARRIPALGAPGTTVDMSTPSVTAYYSRLAVDAHGDAIAVWARELAGSWNVQARRFSAAGALGVTHDLAVPDTTYYQPEVAVGPGGDATVVWEIHADVQAQRISAGGSVGAVVDLSAPGEAASESQVTVDRFGDATVIWSRHGPTGYSVHARRIHAAGGVGAIVGLSAPTSDVYTGDVAADPRGGATAVWLRDDGYSSIVQARRIPAAGPLGATRDLSVAGHAGHHKGSRAAIDAHGDAHVIWVRSGASDDIVQSRRISAAGSPGPIASISASGESAQAAEIAAGWRGNAIAVWLRPSDDVVQASRFTPPPPSSGPGPGPGPGPSPGPGPGPGPSPVPGPGPGPSPGPSPGPGAGVDDSVVVGVRGKRLRVGRHGVARLRARCPRAEQSPPCRGSVTLRTRTKVRFRGKRRRVVLDRGRFSLRAGESRRVRLKLGRRKLALVRHSRRARRARVTVKVRDRAGNRAKVRRRLALVLGGTVAIRGVSRHVGHRRVGVRLRCRARGGCRGRITITTAGGKRSRRVGRRSYRIGRGNHEVRVGLSRRARRALRRRGHLRVRVRAAPGRRHRARRTVTLRSGARRANLASPPVRWPR